MTLDGPLEVVVRGYPGPVVSWGVGAAVALALVLGLTGAASGALALLVGLTGATLAVAVDASVRAERRCGLRALVETTDWLAGAVTSVATATRRITGEHAAPELVAHARHRLRTVAEEFATLADGRIVVSAADHELLVGATATCHRRLQSVTTVPPGPAGTRWWDGEVGRRFWRANLDALGRGVAVTRVFVCRELDPDVAALIAGQRAAGVQTLVARPAEAEPVDPVELVLWEGRRGWEVRVDGAGRVVDHVFTVNEEDLQRLSDTFAAWLARARPVDD